MDSVLETFAALLTYPSDGSREALRELKDALRDAHPEAHRCMRRFAEGVEALSDVAWEELYTRTFDITAQCPLYLGTHLFGPENHKRPQLMTGLSEIYSRTGAHASVELPDHLAVVLRNRHAFGDDEWDELVEFCVVPALEKMVSELGRGDNIYKFVLGALQHTLGAGRGAAIHV
jgi:nitrate reductase assembly molybdenum cofactor insertion protein NarJ